MSFYPTIGKVSFLQLRNSKKWVQNLDKGLLIQHAYANVNWRFTPPYCEEDLTMNNFRTAVSRVAALLNCRPIAKVKVENAMTTLTPNHFLIGKLGGAVSTDDLKHPTKRWKRVHALTDQFWKQFLLRIHSIILYKRQIENWKVKPWSRWSRSTT